VSELYGPSCPITVIASSFSQVPCISLYLPVTIDSHVTGPDMCWEAECSGAFYAVLNTGRSFVQVQSTLHLLQKRFRSTVLC
jgi:hypothetical protein